MTIQSQDSLVFKGKDYSINPKLANLDLLKYLSIKEYRHRVSHNMRGYTAEFIIRNNFFCLNDIFLHNNEEQNKIEQTLQKFYSKHENGRIDWLNDLIILDEEGNKENETIKIILEISNGLLTKILYCNDGEFEELEKTQFKNFIGSNEYNKQLEFYLSMNNDENILFAEEMVIDFIKKDIFSYSTKLYF